MNTQIVYVVIAADDTLFLEEFWASLYSLRHFHPEAKVTALTDAPTAENIKKRTELHKMISELKVVPVPEEYSSRLRSRTIKTSVRNLIEGDYLYIDTDTIIAMPLDDVDNLSVNNLAMVPELHGPFKEHITYNYICKDVKRIFDVDISDAPYWYNAGITFVRDNSLTREFFTKWHENWELSAFQKGQTSDMRALICTDKSYGYLIENLPDVYNCQAAMSLRYLYDAKIIHFWHMRKVFMHDESYSPFCDKSIYKQIHTEKKISDETADKILNCKSSFATLSMVVGRDEINFLLSSVYVVLIQSYKNNKFMRWFLNQLTKCVNLYNRTMRKLFKRPCQK